MPPPQLTPLIFRVLTLKALCDIRLDREDIRDVAEAAANTKPIKPPAPTVAKAPPPPPQPRPLPSRTTRVTLSAAMAASAAAASQPGIKQRKKSKGSGPDGEVLEPHEVRKEPLGVDSSGMTYWLLDCWDTSQEDAVNYGLALYREHPSSIPRRVE